MPGPFKLRKVPRKDLYWVVDSTGKHYSKEGMTKQHARQQQKALYAAESRGEFEGAGLGDIFNKAKEYVSRVVGVASKGVRKGYPPAARKMLEQWGDGVITEMVVRRDPIQSLLNTALNAITLGKWNEMRQRLNYDKMFHLGLVMRVKKNGRSQNIIAEKNEVLNIAPAKAPTKDTDFMPVPLNGQRITLNELLQRAEQAKGSEFFLYDAFNNNCQDFVMGLLQSSGLGNADIFAFVKQPVEALLAGLPQYTQGVARAVTDLGAATNYVIEGEGHKRVKQLMGGCGLCHLLEGGQSQAWLERRNAAYRALGEKPAMPEAGYQLEDGSTYFPVSEQFAGKEMCYTMDADGRKQYHGYQYPEDCKAMADAGFAAWEAKQHPSNVGFRKLNEGLTKAADFAVDVLPLPTAVKEAYQTFAPPGSAYYQPGTIAEKAMGRVGQLMEGSGLSHVMCGRGKVKELCKCASADAIVMPKAKFVKEHKSLISMLDAAGQEGKEQAKELARVEGKGRLAKSSKAAAFKGMLYLKSQAAKPLAKVNPRTVKFLGDRKIAPPLLATSLPKGLKESLDALDLTADNYLYLAQDRARRTGYDPARLHIADNGKNKLYYVKPDGTRSYFGSAKNKDYILWSQAAFKGKVPQEYADQKRATFHKSHEAMKGDWRSDRFSPNNLALSILW